MYIDRLEADGKLSKLLNILVAIIIFSVIVVFHELGHFLLAKKNGIEVTEFSLGMGPRLLSTVKGNTRYSLKLFPIGGSCMMVGEDGEEDGPGSFGHASVWGRISVVAAGPIFNFILAFVFALVITSVMGYDPPKVLSVEENSPAEEAGLQVGDIITSFQGKHISIGRDISLYESLYGMQQDQIKMTVKRDGKKIDLNFKAASEKKYMLGFSYVPDGEPEITEVFVDGAMMKAGGSACRRCDYRSRWNESFDRRRTSDVSGRAPAWRECCDDYGFERWKRERIYGSTNGTDTGQHWICL